MSDNGHLRRISQSSQLAATADDLTSEMADAD